MAISKDEARSFARRWGSHVLLLLALVGGGFLLKAELDREHKLGGGGEWIVLDFRAFLLLIYWGSLGLFALLSTVLRWRRMPALRAYLLSSLLAPGTFWIVINVCDYLRLLPPEVPQQEETVEDTRDSMRLERWWRRVDRDAGRVEVGALVTAQRDCSLGFNSEIALGRPSAPLYEVHAARPRKRLAAESLQAGETRSFTQDYSIAADEELYGTTLYLSCGGAEIMFDSDVHKEQHLPDHSIALPLPAASP